jgi:lysophospholipase L1-like esterase
LQRLKRDVLRLSGVSAVIWLEGINDVGPHGGASLIELEQAITSGARAMRSAAPAVRVIGATLTSARGSPEFGAREEDRKALNAFIRTSGLFDAVIDFEGATINPWSGALKSEYVVPTNGVSTEDGLHPNRAGYLAMAGTIDLDALVREIATEPSS